VRHDLPVWLVSIGGGLFVTRYFSVFNNDNEEEEKVKKWSWDSLALPLTLVNIQ
jgi:hypothetical protein